MYFLGMLSVPVSVDHSLEEILCKEIDVQISSLVTSLGIIDASKATVAMNR